MKRLLTVLFLFVFVMVPTSACTEKSHKEKKDVRTVVRQMTVTSNAFCIGNDFFIKTTTHTSVVLRGESPDGNDIILQDSTASKIERVVEDDGKTSVGCLSRKDLDSQATEKQKNNDQNIKRFDL